MKSSRSYWMSLVLFFLAFASGCEGPTAKRPNFVFFLIDDLGWTDTGVYGSTFYETPNIDRLAREGARFTQFYSASPVCSPTRASIMTGKDPARLQITNWIGGEGRAMLIQAEYLRQLPLEETTLGEAFKEAGYTTGYIGKWHLGAEGFLPPDQGFDYSFAVNHAGQPGSYFYPYENANWPVTNVPDLEDGEEGDYLTDRLTDAALQFIEAQSDTTFFLVFSHYAVHTPLQSKAELTAKYESKAQGLAATDAPAFLPEGANAISKQRQDHAVYAGMIESTDQSVGRVLALLDSLELADRTVVVFVSDNGGLTTLRRSRGIATAVRPLRAGKGWLYEGGVRVPLIIKWPGAVEDGRVIEQPAITMDLYPTLLEIAGLPPKPDQHLDGSSLVPTVLRGGDLDRAFFFHFPHYHGSGNRPSGAARIGDYKLLEWFEDGRIELYDLSTDVGESRDLAAERPEVAGELHEILEGWRQSVGARMPRPNLEWRPN